MTQIYSCIDFIRSSGVLDRPKNFCTKLGGDAGKVFATLEQAFLGFVEEEGHVTIDLTVSANSPTKKETYTSRWGLPVGESARLSTEVQ